MIFLNFNLFIGNSKIGLIPDFIGYIIMIKGLTEMSGENPFFLKVKPFAAVMAVYAGILYFLDILGISVSLGILSYILAVISTIISLYISYNIVLGVKKLEEKYNAFLNYHNLKSAWTLLAIFNLLAYISLVFPILALIFIILVLVAGILFLVTFNKSKNQYYKIFQSA